MARDIEITMEDKSRLLVSEIKNAQVRSLRKYGEDWLKLVQKSVLSQGIFDTGYLYDNLNYQVDTSAATIRLNSGAPYSVYNELGTYKMPARPFMTPSIDQANGTFVQTLSQECDGALSSVQGMRGDITTYHS
jgi:HK97 gp10 family phage protein